METPPANRHSGASGLFCVRHWPRWSRRYLLGTQLERRLQPRNCQLRHASLFTEPDLNNFPGQVGTIFAQSHGFYFHDRPHLRNRQILTMAIGLFRPGDVAYYDLLNSGSWHNVTVGQASDAVCRPTREPHYFDLMSGLDTGTHMGSSVVEGTACEVWTASLPDGTRTTACIAEDGVPRELNSTTNMLIGHITAAFKGITSMRLKNVRVGALGEDTFAQTTACASNYPTPPCSDPGSSQVTTLDLYRIRSAKEPDEIQNRNTGDALGDMAFLCLTEAGKMYRGSVITHWRLTANTSWGQYAYCAYIGGKNVCEGGTDRLMGRESGLGLGSGPLQGQCSENTDCGSWFSLPAAGQCRPGETVGTSGCTWGGAVALRSIAASCLFEQRRLAASCEREQGHAPFAKSAAILEAALASSDPDKGGCPDAVSTAPSKESIMV
ncbi:unnamed protein product [Polarella glacialis]|uniref:Uncharacterized protein n=1 Tax=Polarella glacialis TaxID=89957 RepID=A0A813IR15_POLGL|nr:unnamed protein product [Polarella glacialis]CAE8718627.1 unnamed protein product [Polarella glacialis]